jgi:hypothetical protein
VHKWTSAEVEAIYRCQASVGFASVPKRKRPQLITLPKLRSLAPSELRTDFGRKDWPRWRPACSILPFSCSPARLIERPSADKMLST